MSGRRVSAPAAGIDGCRGGWLVVHDTTRGPAAFIAPSIVEALAALPSSAVVGIDIPIGIPDAGVRRCDVEARRWLGVRGSSVFPAPLRIALGVNDYAQAHRRQKAAGRGLSRQSFGLLPKIREVDVWVRRNSGFGPTLHEVHPELCFATWNGGRPMTQPKTSAGGRARRRQLIDAGFPGVRARLLKRLRDGGGTAACGEDDLCDAMAALWSARRIARGTHMTLPEEPQRDAFGLPMQIKA